MPELPEVEVVRRGLERYVVGRTVRSVEVFHPRAVRRHAAGADDFAAALRGVTIAGARRRGKYLWLPVIPPGRPLAAPSGAAIEANPGETGAEARLAGPAAAQAGWKAGEEVSLEDLGTGEEVGLEELGASENPSGDGPGDAFLRGRREGGPALSQGGSPAAFRPGARSDGGPASAAEDALLAHLGMSGQLLLGDPARPLSPHVRVRFTFTDSGPDLRFTDQRTFGHLLFAPGGAILPGPISHIAPDPMEPAFDQAAFIAKLRARRTGIKAALLDQSLVSGIGNIYADEALWRAKMHWARPAASLSRADAARLLSAVREVLADALAAGGTSFDSLYVNVNGESGYFGRSLAVYGREDQPCPRCGSPIRRDPFMNRSAYSCPVCQRRPRSRSGARDLRRRST